MAQNEPNILCPPLAHRVSTTELHTELLNTPGLNTAYPEGYFHKQKYILVYVTEVTEQLLY